MAYRGDHVLADAEAGDGVVGEENRLAASGGLRVRGGVQGFLEPAVAQGKRLVPGKLGTVTVCVEGAARHGLVNFDTSNGSTRPAPRAIVNA